VLLVTLRSQSVDVIAREELCRQWTYSITDGLGMSSGKLAAVNVIESSCWCWADRERLISS